MIKHYIYIIALFFCCLNLYPAAKNKTALNWGEGGPRYVTYSTITGKTGFITTPSAYCAPMGNLMVGGEFTFSTRAPYGALAAIPKLTFTPYHLVEFGISKEFGYEDRPNTGANMYFDSTPFFLHYKIRIVDWRSGAIAFGQDFDVVPDDSGAPSRGNSSTSMYVVFTGVTSFIGSFNFGFGKTIYFTRNQDALFNFYASWVYSFEKLDDRLQVLLDFSNADYRAGNDYFKVATEDRAYLNFQIRGVLIKMPKFQWTLAATLFDLLDAGGSTPYSVNLNASISTTFNIDLY